MVMEVKQQHVSYETGDEHAAASMIRLNRDVMSKAYLTACPCQVQNCKLKPDMLPA